MHALALASDDTFFLAGGGGGMLQLAPMPELDLDDLRAEEAPPARRPLPDSVAVQTAMTRLREKAAAAEPEESPILAARWLARAGAKAEPATRLALFRAALDAFVKLGRLNLSLRTVGEMGRWFEIDALRENTEILTEIGNVAPADGQKAVVDEGLKLLPEADAAMRPELANTLLATVIQAAERSKSSALAKRVAAVKQGRERIATERRRFADLEAKLKTDSADRDANLEFGFMLCARSQWKDGLGHIAQGGDVTLAKLAEKDLTEPKDGKSRAQLGEGWHEASGKIKPWKALCLSRSKHWYEQAVAVAAGEEKSRVVIKLGVVSAELSDLKERQP